MEKEIEKLIKKLEEREEYLNYMEETARRLDEKDYYVGKWYEVNRIIKELKGLLVNGK